MLIYDVKKYTQAVQTQGVDWQLLLYIVFLGGILPVHLFVAVY